MNTTKGFSLIELLIVLVIVGAVASIGSFAWQSYANNAHLRTAARELTSDIIFMKQNAGSAADTTHTIVFDKTANTYTMNWTKVQTKAMADFGQGVAIYSLPGGGAAYTLTFLKRGTLSPASGSIVLKSGPSTARITFNVTGKTYVTFDMQYTN
jgi:prepilin-type N-terminal cleavage/methylation domain-containing protein